MYFSLNCPMLKLIRSCLVIMGVKQTDVQTRGNFVSLARHASIPRATCFNAGLTVGALTERRRLFVVRLTLFV